MDFNFIYMYLKEYITGLLAERTTWDGTVLIAVGISYLVLSPLATWAAYAAIAYGAWTLLKREINK